MRRFGHVGIMMKFLKDWNLEEQKFEKIVEIKL